MHRLRALYPLNPSLSEELERLLLTEVHPADWKGFDPKMNEDGFIDAAAKPYDDVWAPRVHDLCYRRESVDSFLPRREYQQSSSVSRQEVFSTQDSIKRAILGAAAAATDAAESSSISGGNQGDPDNSFKGRECVFCRNNKEQRKLYRSHMLKDRNGKVTCPVLRVYVCPECSATGDNAHTKRYCPLNRNRSELPDLTRQRFLRSSTGRQPGAWIQQPPQQQRQFL